jgi:hypothetical protein
MPKMPIRLGGGEGAEWIEWRREEELAEFCAPRIISAIKQKNVIFDIIG